MLVTILANSLSVLASELKTAFDNSDWSKVSELDQCVREEFERLSAIDSPEVNQVLVNSLKRYERIYELLIKGAEEHRSEIVSQLSKIKKESQVADTYLSSARYRG